MNDDKIDLLLNIISKIKIPEQVNATTEWNKGWNAAVKVMEQNTLLMAEEED